MKVEVESISCAQPSSCVRFRIGDIKIDALITESDVNGNISTRTIGIGDQRVCFVLTLCGLWKQFSEDFWALREGRGRTLPWDYGDVPAESMGRLLKEIGGAPQTHLSAQREPRSNDIK